MAEKVTKVTPRLPDVSLQTLKSVVLIRDYQSAQAAAHRGGLTISAIARQIADLERKLGVKLFDRHSRGMRPTKDGLMYAEAADRVLAELERAGAQLQLGSREISGQVRIYVSEVLVDEYLLKEVRWLTEKHPKVTVKVTIAFAEQARNALLTDLADVATIFGMSSHGDIEILAKHEHHLVAVIAPGHPLAKAGRHAIRPELLLGESYRLALPPREYGTRKLFDAMLSTQTREAFAKGVQLELNSLQHLKWYALHDKGVAVLPALMVQREVKDGKLVTVEFEGAEAFMTNLSLCRPLHRVLNPAASALAARLRDAFKSYTAKL